MFAECVFEHSDKRANPRCHSPRCSHDMMHRTRGLRENALEKGLTTGPRFNE